MVVFCEHYRGAVAERYDLDPEVVHHTPVGCEHWARRLAQPVDLPTRPRLLVLGAVRRARRPLTVLAAFEALRARGIDAQLVLAGSPGDAAPEFRAALERCPEGQALTWIERPREQDMPRIAAGASLLLHLAEDEGSPVTPLEAFLFGRAVVASDLPAFREALGEEARYVPLDAGPDSIADVLATALAEDDQAAAQRRRQRASSYTWEANARATVAVWRGVFDPGKKLPSTKG